jgi:hypothetical protein
MLVPLSILEGEQKDCSRKESFILLLSQQPLADNAGMPRLTPSSPPADPGIPFMAVWLLAVKHRAHLETHRTYRTPLITRTRVIIACSSSTHHLSPSLSLSLCLAVSPLEFPDAGEKTREFSFSKDTSLNRSESSSRSRFLNNMEPDNSYLLGEPAPRRCRPTKHDKNGQGAQESAPRQNSFPPPQNCFVTRTSLSARRLQQ